MLYVLDTLASPCSRPWGGARRGVRHGHVGHGLRGAVSGVGGGVLRDVLSGKVPGIFYRFGDFYASAAALGASPSTWSAS